MFSFQCVAPAQQHLTFFTSEIHTYTAPRSDLASRERHLPPPIAIPLSPLSNASVSRDPSRSIESRAVIARTTWGGHHNERDGRLRLNAMKTLKLSVDYFPSS